MLKRFFLATAIVIFIIGAPSVTSACNCGKWAGWCTQAWRLGDVIFIGRATSKTPVDPSAKHPGYFDRNVFEFSVAESFSGTAVAGEEITVHTGNGVSDCGYEFKVGTTYLVYASLSDGKLNTSVCTPTSRASEVPHVIRQLRLLQKGNTVANLFGWLSTAPVGFVEDMYDKKPLVGQRVRVINSRNVEQSTITDSEGIYTFQNLPADTYRLEIDRPAGMSNWQLNSGYTYKVEIGAKDFLGCPMSVSFWADGRIKGRVVDEEGNGVAGHVTLELVDEKEAAIARRRAIRKSGYTTASGEFELQLVKPTRYRLAFRRTIGGHVNFEGPPPVMSRVFTVALGQHIEDFRFVLPGNRR